LIALATLYLQPKDRLPILIALDEPELGLHPAALGLLAEMAKTASMNTQLVFATQSSVFLDYFEPDNVVVVNSRRGATEFQRLDMVKLTAWLAHASLGCTSGVEDESRGEEC
jgi:predicted ATPase